MLTRNGHELYMFFFVDAVSVQTSQCFPHFATIINENNCHISYLTGR